MSQQQCKTVVVVGEKGVGKSAVVARLIDNENFDFSTYKPTIDDCFNVVWQLPADGKFVQVQLIDTAAWNEFPAMQSLYIKMSHLVILVYDVVNPDWRKSLLTVINGVRSIKDDADVFVVGNKCDKLTVTDSFTPSDLCELIGHSCVGHVYTSALTQQGIAGMKQLILCSKSQLTEGHYTEFSSIHKRKKLKKKLNGLALALKFTRKQKEKEDSIDGPPKYREPIVYPQEPHYVAYSDLSKNNFDRLFDAAEIGRDQKRRNYKKPSHPDKDRRRQSTALDAGFVSDYSSPGTSPNGSSYSCTPPYQNRGYRKSLDFSYMLESSPSPNALFHRQRSSSTGNEAGYKKKVDVTSSVSTIMSDSSNDSTPYEPNGDGRKVLGVERVRIKNKSPSSTRKRLHRTSGHLTSSMESLDSNQCPASQMTIRGTLSNPEKYKTLPNQLEGASSISLANNLSNIHINGETSHQKMRERRVKEKSPAKHVRHKSDGQIMY